MVLSRNRSFFLWPGFMIFFEIFGGFTNIFGLKLETLGGFIKNSKIKNIETHLVPRLGPRTRAEREARSGGRSGGPRAQPRHQIGFNFLFSHFMNTTQGFQVFIQNIREYHQKFQNKLWNPGQKIKKIRAVYIEIRLWWFFGQKYSFPHQFFNFWHYY